MPALALSAVGAENSSASSLPTGGAAVVPLSPASTALESYLAKPAFDATCDQIFGTVAGVQQERDNNKEESKADALLLLPMLAVATGLNPDALTFPTGYSAPNNNDNSSSGDRRRRKNSNNAPSVLLTATEFLPFARLALREANKTQFATPASGPGTEDEGAVVANPNSTRHSRSAPSSGLTRHLDSLPPSDQGPIRSGGSGGSGIDPNGDVWFDLIPCDAPSAKPSSAPALDMQREQGERGREGSSGNTGKIKKSGTAKGPRRRKLVPLVAPPQPPVPTDRVTEEVRMSLNCFSQPTFISEEFLVFFKPPTVSPSNDLLVVAL